MQKAKQKLSENFQSQILSEFFLDIFVKQLFLEVINKLIRLGVGNSVSNNATCDNFGHQMSKIRIWKNSWIFRI